MTNQSSPPTSPTTCRSKMDPPGVKNTNKDKSARKELKRRLVAQVGSDLVESYGPCRPEPCLQGRLLRLTAAQQNIFAELKDTFLQEADLYRPDETRNQPFDDDLLLSVVEESSFPPKQRSANHMLQRMPASHWSRVSARSLALQYMETKAVAYVPHVTTLQGRYKVVYICPARFTQDKCHDSLRLITYTLNSVQKRTSSGDSSRSGKVALLIDMDQYKFGSSLQEPSQQSFTLENWIALLDLMQGKSGPVKVGKVLLVNATPDVALVYKTIMKGKSQDGFSRRVHFLDGKDLISHLSGPIAMWPIPVGGEIEVSKLVKDFLRYRIALEDLMEEQQDNSSMRIPIKFYLDKKDDVDDNSSITTDSEIASFKQAKEVAAGHRTPFSTNNRSVSVPKSRADYKAISSLVAESDLEDAPSSRDKKDRKKRRSSKKKRKEKESSKSTGDKKRSSSKVEKEDKECKSKSSKSSKNKTSSLSKEHSKAERRWSESAACGPERQAHLTEVPMSDSESSVSQRVTRRFNLQDKDLTKHDLITVVPPASIPRPSFERATSLPAISASPDEVECAKPASCTTHGTRTIPVPLTSCLKNGRNNTPKRDREGRNNSKTPTRTRTSTTDSTRANNKTPTRKRNPNKTPTRTRPPCDTPEQPLVTDQPVVRRGTNRLKVMTKAQSSWHVHSPKTENSGRESSVVHEKRSFWRSKSVPSGLAVEDSLSSSSKGPTRRARATTPRRVTTETKNDQDKNTRPSEHVYRRSASHRDVVQPATRGGKGRYGNLASSDTLPDLTGSTDGSDGSDTDFEETTKTDAKHRRSPRKPKKSLGVLSWLFGGRSKNRETESDRQEQEVVDTDCEKATSNANAPTSLKEMTTPDSFSLAPSSNRGTTPQVPPLSPRATSSLASSEATSSLASSEETCSPVPRNETSEHAEEKTSTEQSLTEIVASAPPAWHSRASMGELSIISEESSNLGSSQSTLNVYFV